MSAWTMKKADLQELAREELWLRLDQSERLTVLELREHSRAQHEAEKQTSDPLAKLPVGLIKPDDEGAADCRAHAAQYHCADEGNEGTDDHRHQG